MSTDAPAEGEGRLSAFLGPVALRLAAIVGGLVLLGFLAPMLSSAEPGTDEFVGIVVGISWSLAALIVLTVVVAFVAVSVRRKLR